MDAELLGPSGRTVLKSTVVAIGNTADNQLVVNDAKVSPHHAEMRLVGQGYCLIDLSSANGTFVNEQRLESGVPRPLNAGDFIRIGDTTFQYTMSGDSQMMPGASATPGQASNTPVVAAPSEFIPGGQVVQEASSSQPPSAHSFYTPLPQQQWNIPLPPAYQPDTPLPPPQQPNWPPAAVGETPSYAAPVPPQSYMQQSHTPPGVPSTVPSYTTPAPEPSYTPPSTQRKPGSKMRIVLIVLAIILVLGIMGGGGLAAYKLTRPQPVISVTSDYHVGSTPAGSIGTVFHVSGHKFSGTSVITFLLDGLSVTGTSRVASDAGGNVKVDVTVTNGWAVGSHILTAKDADGNVTKVAASLIIVPQGQAGTPGPNGAPADDKSFTLDVNVQYQDVATGKPGSFTVQLIINGLTVPAGGTVCQLGDNGKPYTYNGNAGNGISYTETSTFTCSGTYKGGKLSYTETATSDKIDYSDSVSCITHQPYVAQHFEGTFNAPNSISGNFTEDSATAYCNQGAGTLHRDALKGTWTGQL
jgi:pSer/pThr/pTyr-binding forkhead associated (FHA) protein